MDSKSCLDVGRDFEGADGNNGDARIGLIR